MNSIKRILVTAGGTCEDIDTVRTITNRSTGRLGSLIADEFARNGAEVTFVCGENSLRPSEKTQVIEIRSASQLAKTLEALLRENTYDAVIHSMAVSDYTVCSVSNSAAIADAIINEMNGETLSKDEIHECVARALTNSVMSDGKKISSNVSDMVLTLRQTPKVIGLIKRVQPQTCLVGFKLLSGVTEEELIAAGLSLIERNSCDFVLANDTSGISGDRHDAFLMNRSGIVKRAATKQDIAKMICECVKEYI